MGELDSFTLEGLIQREITRINQELERRAIANPFTSAGDALLSSAGGAPPRPSGLQLVRNVGTITVKWNAAPVSNLLKYEVQVADNTNFTEATTFETRTPRFTYQEGDNTSTYFIRVRTVNSGFQNSAYSAILNTTTGNVDTDGIALLATTAIHDLTVSSFTALDTNTTVTTETYGPVTIAVHDADSVIIPRAVFIFDFSSSFATSTGVINYTLDLLRRPVGGTVDTVVDTAQVDVRSTLPTSGFDTVNPVRTTAPSFTTFDQPGAGSFEYRIRVTLNVSGSNRLYFLGNNLEIEFVQWKR